MLIKASFSRQLPITGIRSASRVKRGERGIWQRRYWEHLIRDETGFQRHVDYIHWNPVKNRHVTEVKHWPHSSVHSYVRRGVVVEGWALAYLDIELQVGEPGL